MSAADRPKLLTTALLPLAAALLMAGSPECRAAEADKPAKSTQKRDDQKPSETPAQSAKKPKKKADPYAWKDLFDGKTLKGWKVPDFAGKGEVSVKGGAVVMEMGVEMTGITCTAKVPRENYEFQWEGARLDGIDFFATATFPVGKDSCSFVTGGWGGMVVGLSTIDFYDAADNATTKFHEFKDKQWYKFRVRVTPPKIEVWIDDKQVVDQDRKGHKIGIRDECDLCRPLGISAWVTKGGVRKMRIRKLPPGGPKAKPKPKPK